MHYLFTEDDGSNWYILLVPADELNADGADTLWQIIDRHEAVDIAISPLPPEPYGHGTPLGEWEFLFRAERDLATEFPSLFDAALADTRPRPF